MNVVQSLCRAVPWVLLALLTACQSQPAGDPFALLSTTVQLDRGFAARGESVQVTLTGANSKGAEVTVGGAPAPVRILNGHSFEFTVPESAPAGRQGVAVTLSAQTLLTGLEVLGGDALPREFMLVMAPGSDTTALDRVLADLEYSLVEGPRSLGASEGPCSGELVRITVLGEESGKTLTKLERLTDGVTLWHSDPLSGYSSSTAGEILPVLDAVGATRARLRGQVGRGAVIAVLDTGVSQHAELGSRLLLDEGHDFVDEGSLPLDGYPEPGHGTPVAVLAAGAFSGVAPGALVLPERVCNENGICYTSDVLLGLCHALVTAQDRLGGIGNLVIGVSLGGETQVSAIAEVLEWATERGALLAAAAGNQGRSGSPAHFPAASNLAGVVATTALEASALGALRWDWRPATFANRGSYLDIAAPGVELTSGTAAGGYASGFSGTSYASALTAGALAVWRAAHPEMNPAEVESRIKSTARPLDYAQNQVGAGMLDLSSEPR
jgi:subtilisin